MSALLQPRIEPPIYLYDVNAQDRMRLALTSLTDQLHATEDRWVDTFLLFLNAKSGGPEWHRLNHNLDVIDAQVKELDRQIATARSAL